MPALPTFDAYWLGVTPLIHQVLGSESITILRSSQVEPLIAGIDPSALELANPAVSGATAVDLRLAGGALVNGYLSLGEKLAFAGAGFVGTFAVGAEVKVTGATGFPAVPISPALPGPAPAGSAVVLRGASYVFSNVRIWRDEARDEAGQALAWDKSMRIELPKLGAPTTPRLLDVAMRQDGTKIQFVRMLSEDPSAWSFALGLPSA